MKVGLFGLPSSGKTTVFCALSDGKANINEGHNAPNLYVAKVPDPRLDELTKMYNPKKTVYATIEYTDFPGLQEKSSNSYWGNLRSVDVLVHVVRAFESDMVHHVNESVDHKRDIEKIDSDLIIADLAIIETNLDRLERNLKAGKKNELLFTKDVLIKCRENLENEIPIRAVDLTVEELEAIQVYQFLTQKPFVTALNLGDDQKFADFYPDLKYLETQRKSLVFGLQGKIEMEIAQLEPEEREIFLEDLGIEELALGRFVRSCFELLGLISFFTVGEDEVRAWPIRKDTPASRAAGAIHSDLERGFIRAEVFHYDDVLSLGTAKLKEEGKIRLEGKDYTVIDGDILNIRFNVSSAKKKK